MNDLLDYSLSDLTTEMTGAGFRPFITRQVFQWIYDKGEIEVDRWTNISLTCRSWLRDHYRLGSLMVTSTLRDDEGTAKFAFRLPDGEKIEAVLIPEKNHHTFCLSTQAGCPLNCRFCATGRMGFRRNLSSGEILAQILHLKRTLALPERRINLVFMGMGEPLLNYENLAKALAIITAPDGFHISPRHVTVSTAGILAGICQLEKDFPLVKIALSLNAATGQARTEIMPITKAEPLEPILSYFRRQKRRHRITFEYILMAGVNDSDTDAWNLTKLLRGIPAKINLIPFNPFAGCEFRTPNEERINAFQAILLKRDYTAVVRWSKGRGIGSACGQLAGGREEPTTPSN